MSGSTLAVVVIPVVVAAPFVPHRDGKDNEAPIARRAHGHGGAGSDRQE
jgi:hypothetical protein